MALISLRFADRCVSTVAEYAPAVDHRQTAGRGGKLIAESDGTGAVQREYIWLGSLPLARIEGGNVYFVHADQLGAPQKITDASKTIVWDGTFTPFGKAVSLAGTLTHNLRFPGQWQDSVAGYSQNHFRDYEPSLGNWALPVVGVVAFLVLAQILRRLPDFRYDDCG